MNKIVFFGSGPVAAKSLDFLSKNFEIEAVVTKSIPVHHKGVAPTETLAKKLKLPIIFASTKLDLDKIFNAQSFESKIGIIIDYGVIVSQTVISSFRLGIINSHFSLLPEWRGADPITFSLLSGQKQTGVSLMLIDESLDTGKLIAQENINIKPEDNITTLTDKLIFQSNSMLKKFIPKYIIGEVKPYNQYKTENASYSRKLKKSEGIIDTAKPAEQLEREIRAYLGWPGSQVIIFDNNIIIKKAHVSKSAETIIDLKCADNNYLIIDELIAPSGKTMDAKSFINGYKLI